VEKVEKVLLMDRLREGVACRVDVAYRVDAHAQALDVVDAGEVVPGVVACHCGHARACVVLSGACFQFGNHSFVQ
jgi:hypothetical protein